MIPRVSIIILNWNGLKYTIKCLNSLRRANYPNYEVIVVDNGSIGNDVDVLENKYKNNISVIRNKENLGFAGGNNVAIKKVMEEGKCKYVLLLNNDTEIIQKDWLEKLINIAEQEDKIGLIGCTSIGPGGEFQSGGTILEHPFYYTMVSDKTREEFVETDLVSGACFLIKKEVIDKIGLFDENFYPAYGEESDYCLRAKKNGFKVIYIPDIKIIHQRKVSTRKLSNFDYIGKKNQIRFILLNFPLNWIILRFFYEFLACFIKRKNRNKKIGIWNFKLKKNWKDLIKNLITSLWHNLKDFKEIYYKRKNRHLKIWT